MENLRFCALAALTTVFAEQSRKQTVGRSGPSPPFHVSEGCAEPR